MKHTPGPWNVSNVLSDRIQIGNPLAGEIANIDTNYNNNHKADARLIAAAPELLEAAKTLLSKYPIYTQSQAEFDAIKVLEAAIAKAEGGGR